VTPGEKAGASRAERREDAEVVLLLTLTLTLALTLAFESSFPKRYSSRNEDVGGVATPAFALEEDVEDHLSWFILKNHGFF
jgi:hypothetical protein